MGKWKVDVQMRPVAALHSRSPAGKLSSSETRPNKTYFTENEEESLLYYILTFMYGRGGAPRLSNSGHRSLSQHKNAMKQ